MTEKTIPMTEKTIPIGARVRYTGMLHASEEGLRGAPGYVDHYTSANGVRRYYTIFDNGQRLTNCRRGNLEVVSKPDEVELEVESYL